MNSIATNIIYFILKLLYWTLRYDQKHMDLKKVVKEKTGLDNYIIANWHQNIMAGVLGLHKIPHVAMVSLSKDGQIATDIIEKFGCKVARGSSSRSAKRALVAMVKIMKEDKLPGAITVDGPRGPIHKVKPGVVEIAKLAESAIIPLVPYPEKYWCFHKSWDKFRFPKPFSKIHMVCGEPIAIPKDADKEKCLEIAEEIQSKMLQMEKDLLEKLS